MTIYKKIRKLLNPIPKYEFLLYEGTNIMVDKYVKELQEEGWELAGEIQTKYSDSLCHRMLIPLKRKLK